MVRTASWFRGPRLVVDGSEVKGKRGRFIIRDNRGQEVTVRLISNHIMHYVKLIFTLMLAVLVGDCGEWPAPSSSKIEVASTTEQSFVDSKRRAVSGNVEERVTHGLM